MLSAEQKAAFARDGFLVVERFATAEACAELRARMDELVAGFDPGGVATVFSTREQAHGRARYFLESGGEIRFFFEEEALDQDGRLRVPLERALNKVGHALHDLDPLFDRFSRDPRLAAIAADLGMAQPLLVQSMYIFKQPGIGGEVTSHQDATFLMTDPETCLGLWFALEDASLENGCLLAEPGGHRRPLHARFVREGDQTRIERLVDEPLPSEGLMPLEVPQGALVVLHGRLPHRSEANRSPRSRHAYAVHLVDGTARWRGDNWLKRPAAMPFRGF